MGAALGVIVTRLAPGVQLDPRVGALVGMAAIFAGASRALLASVVFAFEATRQPLGLLPLLGGCTGAYLVSCLLMQNTIMTEKLARRGVRIPSEYAADYLDSVLVKDAMTAKVITFDADDRVERLRGWFSSKDPAAQHQGYPVMDGGRLVGVVTRRDVLDDSIAETAVVRNLVTRPPVVVSDRSSLREAADQLVRANVGRLPVVSEEDPGRIVGILTRSDLLGAHKERLEAAVPQSSPSPLGRALFARAKR
jgi:CBS domain-containing protein